MPPRHRILYFHGFASSPASAKAVALRDLLAPDGIDLHVPDLNIPSFAGLDFEAIVAFAIREASNGSFAALAGSSMGTLIALEVARRGFDLPLVLIAPAFALAERWRDLLPDGDPVMVFNHALGHDAPIHRRFFERMESFRPEAEPPRSRVTVIMGRLDESVPFDGVQRTWEDWSASGQLAEGSQFIEVPDGDHSLLAYVALIARELRRAVSVNRSSATDVQET